MDIFSHGLWGGISFGRKNKKSFWMAFIFGILPDLLSFGLFMFTTIFGLSPRPDWGSGHPDGALIPQYVHNLYNVTHSFIPFLIIFFVLWAIFKKPIWEFSAWGLHILMDIGVHSTQFFPTPFFWPLWDYRFDGIPWSNPIIMIPNVLFLILIYTWYFVIKTKYRNKKIDKMFGNSQSE